MSTTFKIDQFVSITDVQRKIGEVTARLKEEDVVVLRNNKPDFVLVNVDSYKAMREALDFVEHYEIYETIRERQDKKDAVISSSQMAERLLKRVKEVDKMRI